MRGTIKYITSQYRVGGGGAVCLQKATVVKEDVPMILGICCDGHGDDYQELVKEAGEWFQNHFVKEVIKKGPASFLVSGNDEIIGFLQNAGRRLLKEYYSAFAGFIMAGRYACYFKTEYVEKASVIDDSNIETSGYAVLKQFGRCRIVALQDMLDAHTDDKVCSIAFEIEENTRLLLADRSVDDPDIASCLMEVADEDGFARALREIGECYFSEGVALVGINVC